MNSDTYLFKQAIIYEISYNQWNFKLLRPHDTDSVQKKLFKRDYSYY